LIIKNWIWRIVFETGKGFGVEGELKLELVDFGVELELIERGGVELVFEGVDL
jgi:hypothetical protein